ncbi:MAG: hypothetical protein JO249_03275 [Acidobacteria bacterium]|nr:hypothetical protein [Acidobacteriota bacterium]
MAKTLERKSIPEFIEDVKDEYSPETAKIVGDEAAKIEPGQHHLQYERAIYIAIMPDDSSSIAGMNELKRDNTQDVIDGHNMMIDALKGSREARYILFKTHYLNSDTPLNNWVPLDKAVRMTRDNFKPSGGTPLYDKTLSLLTSVIYEKNEAEKRGQQARWAILLITDGDDTSSKATADKVKIILDDMRANEELLPNCEPDNTRAGSIALAGIEDRETDPNAGAYFEQIAYSMGIGWLLHVNRMNPTEMRRAFNTFSVKVTG